MAKQMPKSAGDALANNKPILTLRQAIQKIISPEGFYIDPETKKMWNEQKISPLYSIICNKKEPFSDSNSSMVARTRVERITFSLGRSYSIH